MKCGAALCRRKRWELKLASTAKLTRKSTTSTRYAESQMRTAAHIPSPGDDGEGAEAAPGTSAGESFLERLDFGLMERRAPRAGAGATAPARRWRRRGARDRDRP